MLLSSMSVVGRMFIRKGDKVVGRQWRVTCSEEPPLWALGAAQERVDAAGPCASGVKNGRKPVWFVQCHESQLTMGKSKGRDGIHVQPHNLSLRIIDVSIVIARRIKQVLHPENIVES